MPDWIEVLVIADEEVRARLRGSRKGVYSRLGTASTIVVRAGSARPIDGQIQVMARHAEDPLNAEFPISTRFLGTMNAAARQAIGITDIYEGRTEARAAL